MKTVRPSVPATCDQLVEFRGADRVEARRRLVEEDQLRIERKRPRQRRALDHAARQFRRKFVRRVRLEADELDLEHGELVHEALRKIARLPHRHLNVLLHRQAGKQRAVLEQHAPALLERPALVAGKASRSLPNTSDRAARVGTSPRMARVRTDLPCPEPPTKPSTSPR